MNTTRVCFLLTILCAGSQFSLANDDVLAQMKIFEMERAHAGNGELRFVVPTNKSSLLESDVVVKAVCNDVKRRALVGMPDSYFELLTEYFADGHVRQYVVKLYGRELGFIKVERPSFRKEREYTQARFEITDPSDRIIGEVANAENGEKDLIVRDATRQIIARASLIDQQWRVDSNHLHPLLAAVLICAAEAERHSCQPQYSLFDQIPKVGVTVAFAIGVGGVLWFAYPRAALNR